MTASTWPQDAPPTPTRIAGRAPRASLVVDRHAGGREIVADAVASHKVPRRTRLHHERPFGLFREFDFRTRC